MLGVCSYTWRGWLHVVVSCGILGWHLTLTQLQRSGMTACMAPRLYQRRGGSCWKEFRWLARANTNTWGQGLGGENWLNLQESGVTVLTVGAFSDKRCLSCLQSRPLGTVIFLLLGIYWETLLFSLRPSSIHRSSFAGLWMGESEEG